MDYDMKKEAAERYDFEVALKDNQRRLEAQIDELYQRIELLEKLIVRRG